MAASPANPLVAGRVDTTEWYTGIGIAEGIADLSASFNGGGWIDGLIGGFGTSIEALTLVVDPLGTVASWGAAWLMEHFQPLSDALDWLAGDADQVTAYAATWKNIAAANLTAANDLGEAVNRDVVDWSGDAGAAYRAQALSHQSLLTALSEGAETMSTIVQGAGLIVALVREMVRDLIADFVSLLAVRLPTWLAEAGLTFGIATPWVASQVAALVSRWVEKIGTLLLALTRTMRKLDSDFLQTLAAKIDDIAAKLGASTSPSGPARAGDGSPGRGAASGPGTPNAVDLDRVGAGGALMPAHNEVPGGAFQQNGQMACYAAVGDMLSDGQVSQADILARYGDEDGLRGGTPGEVARALGEGWRGGTVDVPQEDLPQVFDLFNGTGPWGATMRGAAGGQHMVVVDGLAPDGSVRIRDPYNGSSYTTPYDEFMGAWLGGAVWRV